MAAKMGTVGAFTVIFSVVVVAHCPAFGVKVYVVVPAVAVLTAGAQTPTIAGKSFELVGRTGFGSF